MQDQGIEEQRIVNTGLLPIARDLGLPLVCTNDVHYLRQADQHPHDILLCIGTGKSVSDEKRLRYHGDQFFLKSAKEMAAVFGDYPDALANTMRIAERCDVKLPEGRSVPAELHRACRRDGRFVLRAHGARRIRRAPGAFARAGRSRRAAASDRRVRVAPRVRDRSDPADEVPGLLPHRLGLHSIRARARDSGRTRPRVVGRQPRRVLPQDHRRRSAALRSVLRAVPQPRARHAAGYRRGLLRAPAR